MTFSRSLYFDYQASTPVHERVLQKMLPYFRDKAGNPHSTEHSVGWQTSHAVEDAGQSIANLIGADRDEIFFTSGATEANNLALLGLGKGAKKSKRRRILVSAIEHKCVLAVARILEEQFEYHIDKLPVDYEGRVSISVLENSLDNDVLAVSIMAVNNEIGTIQNINGLAETAHKAGAIFHCDAAQAPVAMDISNFAQDVDLLSLSGHKMYGPQGIGALYIRRDLQDKIEPLIYGGGQQNGLRSGTLPVPLCVGMGAAADLINEGQFITDRARVQQLRDRFVELLINSSWGISLNGPSTRHRHPGNANLLFRGVSADDILTMVQPKLAASTGSACTSGTPEPSYVLKAIGLTTDEADASIRFSLGIETNDDEIDKAVNIINETMYNLTKSHSL